MEIEFEASLEKFHNSQSIQEVIDFSGAVTTQEVVEAPSVSLETANGSTAQPTDRDPMQKPYPEAQTSFNGRISRKYGPTDNTRQIYRSARGKVNYEDFLGQYLNQIGQFPLLDKNDEIRLGKLKDAGSEAKEKLDVSDNLTPEEIADLQALVDEGERAKQDFINANYRLVVMIARKYQGSGLELLDIIQLGNEGLIRAVEKFDWQKGFKFSTYAPWWIRQRITRGIDFTSSNIYIPKNEKDKERVIARVNNQLEGILGRQPTIEELADATNFSPEKVKTVLSYPKTIMSLSEPLNDDGDLVLEDIISDFDAADPIEHANQSLLPAIVNELLSVLDPRQQAILILRFGLDGKGEKTLEEVAKHFGITRERVRQIEATSIKKIKRDPLVKKRGLDSILI